VNVRQAAASGAEPAFVESKRQQRNPENMPGVESADLHGTTGLRAVEAVVIAKSDALRPKVVHAVEDEQGSSRWTES